MKTGIWIAAVLVVAAFGLDLRQEAETLPVTYPDGQWERARFEDVGLNAERWKDWIASQPPRATSRHGRKAGPNDWGAVLVKDGYLVYEWGDPTFREQSASVGKAFTKLVLQLAIDRGLITSQDDPVHQYWTGAGQLSAEYKIMDAGFNAAVTFRHLWTHTAGFPVTNGFDWRRGKGVPDWASWTGDPAADNFAHRAPGQGRHYSSGGYWRLTQALTAIWGSGLKQVLDEEVFRHIGIGADSWQWLPGAQVHDDKDFYPAMPGYGAFIDPPYEIDGHPCVGGGGWVVMSPSDLARVGWLIAQRGQWNGKQLITDGKLLGGHAGGNDSDLHVDKDRGLVFVKVTVAGLEGPPL